MCGDHRLRIDADVDDVSLRALAPETTDTDGRSPAHIEDGAVVVEADDLRSLRASLNGWTRLLSVAEETRKLHP